MPTPKHSSYEFLNLETEKAQPAVKKRGKGSLKINGNDFQVGTIASFP